MQEFNVVKSSKSTFCLCFPFFVGNACQFVADQPHLQFLQSLLQTRDLARNREIPPEVTRVCLFSHILSLSLSLSLTLSLFDTLCKIFGAVCLSVQIKRTCRKENEMSYASCHPETRLLPPPSQDFAAVATCPVSPRQGIETALSTRFPWKMCPLTIVPFPLIFIQ